MYSYFHSLVIVGIKPDGTKGHNLIMLSSLEPNNETLSSDWLNFIQPQQTIGTIQAACHLYCLINIKNGN